MDTFLVTLLAFGAALIGMAIGVILAKKPLAGTCGGLGQLSERFGASLCDVCEDDPSKRPEDCPDRQAARQTPEEMVV